ncbi:MAG TPA: hypothetical protein VN699_20570 [Pirellulales bacterium]|nr:hypothetical protein [Pirellulales bacterium]
MTPFVEMLTIQVGRSFIRRLGEQAMSKRTLVVALLAVGAGWVAMTWAAEGSGKTVAELREARLALAKRGFDLSLEAYGKLEYDRTTLSEIAEWSKRAVEVERQGGDKAKLRQSLEEHRDRMQRLFDMVVAMQKHGMLSEIDAIQAEYPLLEAECWVAEAKSASN